MTTLIVIPTQSQTVTILGWDASNTGGGFGSSPWTPATTSSNLTVVGLTRGSSISTSGSPAGSCWGGSGGWGGGQSDASSFYFTLAANSGYRVSLTSTLAGSTRKSTTGPTGCDIYYSVNGGSFTQASGSWTTSSTSNPGTAGSTNLSGITALQNVPAGQVIKFRVYATGATTGNWYLNNGTSGVQCLRLGGTILGSATTTLTGLGYTFGGSSTAQNFTVNGAGLTSSNATVTINGSTNYEVSTTSATSGFGSSATLTASGGSISGGNVWVRLKSGLSAGSYNSETITIGGGGVTGVPIICSGTVAAPAAPNIALNNTGFTQISSDALPNPGATGLILSRFKADITNTNATLNSIAFKTAGSYSTADITSIDLYYGTSSTMPGSPLASTSTIPASGGAITFTSLSKSITNNTSGYFWIVANLDASATVSNTIGVLGTAGTGLVLTFASGTPTGNISDPSLQTITSATAPSIVLNTAGFILNGAFGNQCINTSSSVSSYSVSGNNLITDLVITAPSGFEISTSNSPFVSNSQLNLSPQGGTVSSTNIYMRYIPTTVGTSGALNITHTSTGATSGDVAVSGIGIGTAPSITSGSVGSITSNSAIVSNSILANNCFTILSSGVCYATSTNPTTADSIIDNTSNGTPFNSSLYNLLPNTAYHFRSFVTYNNGGLQTIYGSDIGFNTLKLEPLDFPTLFSCGSTTSSTLPLTWTDASSPQAPDGYLIKWSSVSYASISAPSDGIAEANGANTRNVAQGTQTYTPSGLASATTYYFKIWSYTNNGSNINYKLVGEPQTNCTTQPYQQTSTATWNFTDGTANSSSSAITYLTVSAITQGNNNGSTTLVTSTSASTGYTGSSGTNNAGAAARTGALATGASGSAYMEFSLTPATGYTVALTAISFGNRSTGTGPQSYTLRSSLDSYSSDIATGSLQNNSTWALYSNTGLTTISALSSAITFRIYGYSGSGSVVSGTANWRIDDINITVNVSSPRTITTGNISQLAYCASGAISIPYSTNINFLPGNVFKAQLSNSNGSFASPTQIGLVTAVSSGTISTTIPANASYGSGYRIRVIGTAPAIVGSDNGTDITINTRPIPTFSTFPSAKSCINSDIIYTTQGGQSNYIWTVSGLLNTDYIITAGGTGSSDSTLTLQWLTPGNKTVTVNYSNAAGCTGVSNASVTTAVNIAGTWLGAVSNDWNNPLNWCGGVPTSSTDVTLVSGVAYWPVINADVDCRNLSIPAGDTLSINGSYLLRILGDIAGSGVVLSTGKLYMSGKGSAADISGISVVNIEFDNLYGFNLTGNLSILGISKLTEGSFTGSGSIKYGTSSTLYYNGSASQTSTNIEWPTTTSPKSIIVGICQYINNQLTCFNYCGKCQKFALKWQWKCYLK
ncbi:MAG: hypothetical protein HYZ42_03035 [Bacteroidetes bacterium]|nr:hypothetical protein [Bacteroidota bacterium]